MRADRSQASYSAVAFHYHVAGYYLDLLPVALLYLFPKAVIFRDFSSLLIGLDAVVQSLMHLQDILQLGPHLILLLAADPNLPDRALIHDITILFKKNARRWPGMEFVKLLAIYLRIQFTKDYDIVHLAKFDDDVYEDFQPDTGTADRGSQITGITGIFTVASDLEIK